MKLIELEKIIKEILELKRYLKKLFDENYHIIENCKYNNEWFDEYFLKYCINHWINILDYNSVKEWISNYKINYKIKKKIGLIMAGNIPLVGLHDLLCAILTSYNIIIKPSSKDKILILYIIESLIQINKAYKYRISLTNDIEYCIKKSDLLIATGSDNICNYINELSLKKCKLLRGSKTSISIIDYPYTKKDIYNILDDMLLYYGLGCRSITFIYIKDIQIIYDILKYSKIYNFIKNNSTYMNNFIYNKTLFDINNKNLILYNEFIIFEQIDYSNKNMYFSPLSTIKFKIYKNIDIIIEEINTNISQIQCITTNINKSNLKKLKINTLKLGQAQKPSINTYADNVDTINFIINQSD